jgi:hypothetical protein
MLDNGCATISVPDAGRRYFGLSRDGSYDAARRGEIPTLRIGRKLRVPIAAMERKLADIGSTAGAVPASSETEKAA